MDGGTRSLHAGRDQGMDEVRRRYAGSMVATMGSLDTRPARSFSASGLCDGAGQSIDFSIGNSGSELNAARR